MMCKDNATTTLLDVPTSVQSKYADQANNASLSFLMNGLNLLSRCDFEYKSRKNQRLHIEITLMKLTHLNSLINLTQLEEGAEKK